MRVPHPQLARPRLSRSEKSTLRSQLCCWQTPEEMWRVANEAGDHIGSTNLFNQGGLEFLRDALTAAELGMKRRASRVRLVAEVDRWPDFELEVGVVIERFEAVEVDDPERRRGDEYRNWVGGVIDPVTDWIARAEQTPTWIAAGCQKKMQKRYAGRASLVIYLNVSDHGIRQTEIENSFPSVTAMAKDQFDAIWVLWKSKAYQVWQGGTHVTMPENTTLAAEVAAKRLQQRRQIVMMRRREYLRKRGRSG